MNRLLFLMWMAAGLSAQAPYQRIVNADKEPQNWLTYSGTYDEQRFSPLTQITSANVGRTETEVDLSGAQWIIVETTPLAFDGMIYISRTPDGVSALDAQDGQAALDVCVLPKDLNPIDSGA